MRHVRALLVVVMGIALSALASAASAAATTFTVTSNADTSDSNTADGVCSPCTLRAAIEQATATGISGSPYTINFNIGGSPVITLTNTLPDVREKTTINGFTQPGYTPGVLMVELNGNGVASSGLSLSFNASNSVIQGLVIRNMTSDGIDITGVNGVLIQQCMIGTDVTGMIDRGNGGYGISIDGATNAIGGTIPGPLTLGGLGNVISGNATSGILVTSVQSIGNTIRNNFIGTNQLGTGALQNDQNGVVITGSATGTNLGDANVISGNAGDGVVIDSSGTQGNTVYANHIGTDITGAFALGNGVNGVHITGAQNNLVGGPTIAQRNVISANAQDGVQISGSGNLTNMIQGNFIGTNGLSTGALANGRYGVYIFSSANSIVGTFVVAPQVISGNTADGVRIGSGTGNTVSNNNIGEDLGGASVPNGGPGISVVGSSTGNILTPNKIAFNGALGIDLSSSVNPDGVTPNDLLDPDTGGNDLQNYPVIATAVSNGSSVTVTGTFNSTAGTPFTLDFFYNDAADPSGFGEGQSWDSNTAVATDPSGNASFSIVLSTNVPVGKFITATATGPSGTSEFSLAVPVVPAQADLSVTKTAAPEPVPAGTNLTYTITLANAGPQTAQTVSLSDTVPANTTFVSFASPAGYTCTTPGVGGTGAITCTNPSVASGANDVFTLTVKVAASATGTISNTATATTATIDPNPGNNSATAISTVTAVADLVMAKTDSPDPVAAGANLTYTLTLTNSGPSDAATVQVADTLPVGTTFVSLAPAAGFTCTSPAVGSGGTVACNAPTLAATANAVFTLVVKVDPALAAGTVISNTATGTTASTDPNLVNDSATATTTVATQADLSATKTDSPDPVNAGSNITYTISVLNNGPSNAQAVNLTDTIPANTTFVSLTSPAGYTCTTPAVGGTGPISCTNTFTASGATDIFTLVVAVNGGTANGTVITNTASFTSTTTDPNPANNSASATTTVSVVVTSADIAVTKTAAPEPVVAGTNLTYTITVTNAGPDAAASFTLSDTLPPNTTFVSLASPAGYTCTTPAVGGTGAVSCTNPSVASGANNAFTLVVNVLASAASGSTISNTVTVASTTPDPSAANNTATAISTVAANADLALTKTDAPDPVLPGANITYTIQLTNAGPSDAQTVSLSDPLPANTTFVSLASPAGFTCTTPAVGGTGTVSCSNPTVLAGANDTFTLVVAVGAAVPNGTVITNTATVTTATTDPNPANDTATTTTTTSSVVVSADLSLAKAGAPNPVIAGTNLTYTITLANAGPDAATAVSLSDALPAGTTFVSLASPAGYTCTTPAVGGTGTVTCTNPSVASGASDVFTLIVNVAPGAAGGSSISNTATVTTTATDANPANNTATSSTLVSTAADIAVTKTDAPDPVVSGSNITYTIQVSNAGPSDAQTVVLTDNVPANTTFVSLTSGAGFTCTTPAVGGTGAVTCTAPALLPGANVSFSLVVQVGAAVPAATIITNTATVTSGTADPNDLNNSATATTTTSAVAVSADLSVTKTGTPNPVAAGANITYTITVANAGPDAATTVSLADTVPANTKFVSLTSPAGYTCTTPAVGGTGAITCTNPSVASGANGVFTLVVNVGAAVAGGTAISNTATVSSATTDPNALNNSATVTVTTSGGPVLSGDLSVTKTAAPSPVTPGANITYTITVANAGPDAAATVTLADNVPANTTFVSLTSPAGFTCTTPAIGGTGAITCTNPSVASGASDVFTLVVNVGAAVPGGTTITNTATVSSATSDPNAANNTATNTDNVTIVILDVPALSGSALLLLALSLALAGWFIAKHH